MPLTPRERILSEINHEEPGRVPVVMGVSNSTSMKMNPNQALKEKLGIIPCK